jgi:monoamine oxidase
VIQLHPALPARHEEAIRRLALSSLEKVVMRFEAPVLPPGMKTLLSLGDDHPFIGFHDMSRHADACMLVGFLNPTLANRDRPADGWTKTALELLRAHFTDVPEPVATVCTDWAADSWSRGSYSFIPVGASADDMDALASPFSSSLAIAGEHTSSRYYGTVHGAFVSGRREAARMLR